jgi:hypothetical protein
MTATANEKSGPAGFIQVMRGTVTDRDELRSMVERWLADLAPGAAGWLGTTAGVAEDGTSVALVRFASAQDARRNSDRPEQHQWWMETAKLFAGEVTFHDCTDIETFGAGGSDAAGFVQIMEGRVSDVERMRELGHRLDALEDQSRPDLIGGLVALHGDGGFTMAAYFTDEAAARAGEQQPPPPEVRSLLDEQAALMSDLTYVDLREPWLFSPR